jgi:hypothetical protein
MNETISCADDTPVSVRTFSAQNPDMKEGAVRQVLFDKDKRQRLERAGAVGRMGRRIFIYPRRWYAVMRDGGL